MYESTKINGSDITAFSTGKGKFLAIDDNGTLVPNYIELKLRNDEIDELINLLEKLKGTGKGRG